MIAFYKERRKAYQVKMMRYMKYVFNDHMMILLFFLMGGICLYYPQFVKQLAQYAGHSLATLLIVILSAILLSVGDVATLIQPADEVFLLVKEKEMIRYLLRALRCSLWLPALVMVVGTLLLTPLFSTSDLWTPLWIFMTLYGLKLADLYRQLNQYYRQNTIVIYSIFSLVALCTMIWWPVIGVIIAAIALVVQRFILKKSVQTHHLDWREMIESEQRRLTRWYKFINLFTDVPEIKQSVKRRAYLDGVLKLVPETYQNTHLYLYIRQFIRGTEYSGLVVRLTLIGIVLLAANTSFYLGLGISALFVYLLLFQLIPMYQQFDYIVLERLFPIVETQKRRNLIQLLITIGMGVAVLFTITVMLVISFKAGLVVLALLILEVFLLCIWYTPHRLKKMN